MGTTSGLDSADSVGVECLVADEEFLVFLRGGREGLAGAM